MNKNHHVKTFDYNDIDDISKAEKLKAKLENKGLSPSLRMDGLNSLIVEWWTA